MTWDAIGELDPQTRHAMNEGAWDPQARLRDMDAMGVDQTCSIPPGLPRVFTGARPGRGLRPGPGVQQLDRRFLPGSAGPALCCLMVPLQNMDFALEELQRVARPGCRGAFLRPMFIEGRYFTHPYYDPLWAELESLGLTAAVHPTPGLWNPDGPPTAHFSKKSGAGSIKRRSLAVASDPLLAEGVACKGPPSLPARCRSDIRWRRSCPTGWTITCSSRPR